MFSRLNLPLILFLLTATVLFTWVAGYRYAPGEKPREKAQAPLASENPGVSDAVEQTVSLKPIPTDSEDHLRSLLLASAKPTAASHQILHQRIAQADRILNTPNTLNRAPPGPRQRSWQQRLSGLDDRFQRLD